MSTTTKFLLRAAGLAALLSCGVTQAAVVTYTSHSSFMAAAAGLGTQHLSNFDSTAVGTSYADGAGPAGAGFTMTSSTFVPANTPTVQSQFWTTSGTHYLGLDNADTQFSNGDTLTFALSASMRAFGLYIIAATDNGPNAGELSVSVGGSSLSNSTADLTDPASGSSAFFFGFISDADITSAVLDFGTPGDPNFFFNAAVDDVILFEKARTAPPIDPGNGTVPEPSSLALLGLAGLALTAARRRSINQSIAQPANPEQQP